MIEVVKGVHRIPNEIKLGSEDKQEKLSDIGTIIGQSVEYKTIKN